jgi:crotonobetainyl-CoA:carnitine CoA-transferase CaiB-like acyl-CoA transferase
VSSFQIFGGVSAALFHREKTGKGQKVEFNLYHAGVWMLGADIMDALVGVPLRITDPRKPDNPLYETYKTKDERWLQLTAGDRYAPAADPEGKIFWASFCHALNRSDLINDPRFATTKDRQKHREELTPILDEVFATKSYDEWEKLLSENNLMFGPILSPLDVIKDPQALVNDFFVEVQQPDVGKMKLISTPIKFVQDPAMIKSATPLLGQHTDEILSNLDYGSQDIFKLRSEKVIL